MESKEFLALVGVVVLLGAPSFLAFYLSIRKKARMNRERLAVLPESERVAANDAARSSVRRKGGLQAAIGALILLVAVGSFVSADKGGGVVWIGGCVVGFALLVAGLAKAVVGRDM